MLSRLKEVAQNALLAINAAQADVEEFASGVTQRFVPILDMVVFVKHEVDYCVCVGYKHVKLRQ